MEKYRSVKWKGKRGKKEENKKGGMEGGKKGWREIEIEISLRYYFYFSVYIKYLFYVVEIKLFILVF